MTRGSSLHAETFWTNSKEAFDKENPFKLSLLSAEGHQVSVTSIHTYAHEHRGSFLKIIESLTPDRREIAVEYLILRKTEAQIAVIHGRHSQAMIGQEIFSIVQSIAARIALPHPSRSAIEQTLSAEKIPAANYAARVIYELLGSRCQRLRPDIEKCVSRISSRLGAAVTWKGKALGTLIRDALSRRRKSDSQKLHAGRAKKVFTDPPILGEFEIDIEDENAHVLMTAHADEVSNASKIERKAS